MNQPPPIPYAPSSPSELMVAWQKIRAERDHYKKIAFGARTELEILVESMTKWEGRALNTDRALAYARLALQAYKVEPYFSSG